MTEDYYDITTELKVVKKGWIFVSICFDDNGKKIGEDLIFLSKNFSK